MSAEPVERPTITKCRRDPSGGYEFTVHLPHWELTWLTVTERQACVLVSLAQSDATVSSVAFDWPGLSDSAARGRIAALERKNLVKRTRWDGVTGAWEYGLTPLGSEAAETMGDFDDEGGVS